MATTKSNYHRTIANYFAAQVLFFDGDHQKKPHIRKCVELPFQQTKAEMWDEVTETLSNLEFIQAKAVAKMTYDLVKDFNNVLEVIPDNAENIRQEKTRQERMEKYVRDLIACARGEITRFELKVPESITPWSQEKTTAEVERMKSNPTRLDLLQDFNNFLGQEAGNLHNYTHENINFAYQQAWNYARNGPVGKASETFDSSAISKLFLCPSSSRPDWNPLPEIFKILSDHFDSVLSTSITPDGKFALSGSSDCSCILWDLETGQALKILKGHQDSVTSVRITPDGKFALTGSADKTCIFWDLEAGQVLKTLEAHTDFVSSVDISPEGKYAFTGSNDCTCILWSLETGQALKILKDHDKAVTSVCISSDGKCALSASYGHSILWDLKSGEIIRKLDSFGIYVSMTPDGKRAFSTDHYSQTCKLWDLETGTVLKILKGHTSKINAVSICPDGKKAISCDGWDKVCILWDLDNGNAFKILKGHNKDIYSVSINADAKIAFSGSADRNCILWNLETGQESNRYAENISTICISPDRKFALTSAQIQDNNHIVQWDISTGLVKNKYTGHALWPNAINIGSDNKIAVSGSEDHTCIVWNIEKGHILKKLEGHDRGVTSIIITPDGHRILSCSSNECFFWDLKTGKVIKRLLKNNPIYSIILSHDGKRAFLRASNGVFFLWEIESDQVSEIKTEHKNGTKLSEMLPDGKSFIFTTFDNDCYHWDIKAGQIINSFVGHLAEITAACITPDGRNILTSSKDKTCIMWSIGANQPNKILTGHNSQVEAICVTPDGKRAVSCSDDRTCILWDLKTGTILSRFAGSFSIKTIQIFPQGIFCGGERDKYAILKIKKEILCPESGIVTVKSIWDYNKRKYLNLSADCPFCGHRFAPPGSVLKTINNITKKAALRPDQSPCLELPDEAWEDPGLLGNCPKCGGALKFNPFVAGGEK